jgi:hypothetical protein
MNREENTTEIVLDCSPESYIKSFTEKEMKAYLIAKDHLGTSFQLEKSNGYLEWKKEQMNREHK